MEGEDEEEVVRKRMEDSMGVVSVDQMVYKWELQEAVDNGGEEAYGRRNGSRNGDVKKRSVSQK